MFSPPSPPSLLCCVGGDGDRVLLAVLQITFCGCSDVQARWGGAVFGSGDGIMMLTSYSILWWLWFWLGSVGAAMESGGGSMLLRSVAGYVGGYHDV